MTVNPTTVPGASLTRKEAEILAFLIAGYSNAEVAGMLCISHTTVSQYIYQARIKMEARTPYHLIALAMTYPERLIYDRS